MSAVGVYQYVDDGGVTFQVALPSDFATALGYTAAIGSEPYLPPTISPRYANYVSLDRQLWRSAVVTTRGVFASAPSQVIADGITYNLTGAYGERFQQLPGGNTLVVSGPQGPKGDTGSYPTITTDGASLANDFVMSSANQDFLVVSKAVVAGTYLAIATITIQSGATTGDTTGHLVLNSALATRYSTSQRCLTSGAYYTMTLSAIFAPTGVDTISLYCRSTVTNATVKSTSQAYGNASRLNLVKLA